MIGVVQIADIRFVVKPASAKLCSFKMYSGLRLVPTSSVLYSPYGIEHLFYHSLGPGQQETVKLKWEKNKVQYSCLWLRVLAV